MFLMIYRINSFHSVAFQSFEVQKTTLIQLYELELSPELHVR